MPLSHCLLPASASEPLYRATKFLRRFWSTKNLAIDAWQAIPPSRSGTYLIRQIECLGPRPVAWSSSAAWSCRFLAAHRRSAGRAAAPRSEERQDNRLSRIARAPVQPNRAAGLPRPGRTGPVAPTPCSSFWPSWTLRSDSRIEHSSATEPGTRRPDAYPASRVPNPSRTGSKLIAQSEPRHPAATAPVRKPIPCRRSGSARERHSSQPRSSSDSRKRPADSGDRSRSACPRKRPLSGRRHGRCDRHAGRA